MIKIENNTSKIYELLKEDSVNLDLIKKDIYQQVDNVKLFMYIYLISDFEKYIHKITKSRSVESSRFIFYNLMLKKKYYYNFETKQITDKPEIDNTILVFNLRSKFDDESSDVANLIIRLINGSINDVQFSNELDKYLLAMYKLEIKKYVSLLDQYDINDYGNGIITKDLINCYEVFPSEEFFRKKIELNDHLQTIIEKSIEFEIDDSIHMYGYILEMIESYSNYAVKFGLMLKSVKIKEFIKEAYSLEKVIKLDSRFFDKEFRSELIEVSSAINKECMLDRVYVIDEDCYNNGFRRCYMDNRALNKYILNSNGSNIPEKLLDFYIDTDHLIKLYNFHKNLFDNENKTVKNCEYLIKLLNSGIIKDSNKYLKKQYAISFKNNKMMKYKEEA